MQSDVDGLDDEKVTWAGGRVARWFPTTRKAFRCVRHLTVYLGTKMILEIV